MLLWSKLKYKEWSFCIEMSLPPTQLIKLNKYFMSSLKPPTSWRDITALPASPQGEAGPWWAKRVGKPLCPWMCCPWTVTATVPWPVHAVCSPDLPHCLCSLTSPCGESRPPRQIHTPTSFPQLQREARHWSIRKEIQQHLYQLCS